MKYEGLSEELVKRLENLPPDEPRSKLEPGCWGATEQKTRLRN
jgi:hypothetical protein